MFVVPKGVEHKPIAENECKIISHHIKMSIVPNSISKKNQIIDARDVYIVESFSKFVRYSYINRICSIICIYYDKKKTSQLF